MTEQKLERRLPEPWPTCQPGPAARPPQDQDPLCQLWPGTAQEPDTDTWRLIGEIRAVTATRPPPASEHGAKEELTVPRTEQATTILGLPALFNKTRKRGPQTSMENSLHLWGAGPWGSADPRQRGMANQRDFEQQLRDPKLPAREGHVSFLVQYLPISFPVKAVWLCASVAPGSLGRALGQNSRGVASDCPFRPLLSLCSCWKNTQAGMPHRRACHGTSEGCSGIPVEH